MAADDTEEFDLDRAADAYQDAPGDGSLDEEDLDFILPTDMEELRMERRIEMRSEQKLNHLTELTWTRFKRICSILAETGAKYKSCEAGGFAYATVREAIIRETKLDNPAWQELWDLSHAHYRESLMMEARSRARDGWKEPLFDKDGNVKGYLRKKSDRLLELMLKGEFPEMFRDNVHHTGSLVTEGAGLDLLKDLSLKAKKAIRQIIMDDMAEQALIPPPLGQGEDEAQ